MLELGKLAATLQHGDASAEELALTTMADLDTRGRALGAVVNLLEDRALHAARRADRERREGRIRGPLHGIPYGAKDLLSARGSPTTWGVPAYRDRSLQRDAAAIAALERAGAVLVAKLATDELAGGLGAEHADASLTGPCHNPHDPGAFAGSSSGGPAAAVGAGILPFALGTETIGSIIEPAAFCGVSALRPTRGRVDVAGVMPVAPSLDVLGPLAAGPADCGRVLEALIGRPASAAPPIRSVGIPEDALATVDSGVADAFGKAVAAIRSSGVVTTTSPALGLPAGAAAFLTLVGEFAGTHRKLLRSPLLDRLAAPENRRNAAAWLALSADAYLLARRVATACARAMTSMLADVDALAYPAFPTVAPPLDAHFAEALAPRHTHWLRAAGPLAGLPAVVVPTGRAERGLPTALCLVGRPHADEALLQLAEHLRGPSRG